MTACRICHNLSAAAEWAWQPLGPDPYPICFITLGSHYRSFPVIKVCEACRVMIRRMDLGDAIKLSERILGVKP